MTAILPHLLSSLLASSASGCEASCPPLTAVGLSAAPSIHGHVLAIKGLDDSLRTSEWDSKAMAWTAWKTLPGQTPGISEPWVQAPVGGINNIFALHRQANGKLIEQWLRDPEGSIVRSIGIGDANSVASRPVCGRIGTNGRQALFAVFADSSVRMRVWDSLARTWGGWSDLSMRSRLPLTLNQVTPDQLNLFATPDSTLMQNWWKGSVWSGWVRPASNGIGTDPVSVNLNSRDHFLFAIGPNGTVLSRFWNGSYWTDWTKLDFPVSQSLAAVALGDDSLLLYGIDRKGVVLRTAWNRLRGWSEAQVVQGCLGSKDEPPVPSATAKGTRRLVAANAVEGILLVVQGGGDSLFSRIVHSASGAEGCWKPVPSQPKILSTPWLQAPTGGMNNLYALGQSNGTPRTFQWIYQGGKFQTTIGIGESERVTSLASGRIGSDGKQALFGVFKDSSIHMRVWDSLGRAWGGWSPLDHKTTRSLEVVQVTDDQLNLYATMPNGRVDQRWWMRTDWSAWVVPAYEPIVSGPSSVNFDETFHVLFGVDSLGRLVERKWDGNSWTGWQPLPYAPASEPVAVVRNAVLHLFFLDKAGNVVEIERTLGSSWKQMGVIPAVGSSGGSSSESNEPLQTAFVHRGELVFPSQFLPLESSPVVVHADGRRERIQVSGDGTRARLHLRGVGVVQSGAKRLRVISLD